MRNKQIDTQDISKKLFRKWKYYGHKMLPICWLYTQYSSWNDIISAMSKIPQCIVKPQKQSVFPMFWVPLHRLVISRAGDRALASKYCAINSSIFSVLLCMLCTIRQISGVCNGALGGIYWPLVEDILPESGYSKPSLCSSEGQANCGVGLPCQLVEGRLQK